jgi:hypothetical protein
LKISLKAKTQPKYTRSIKEKKKLARRRKRNKEIMKTNLQKSCKCRCPNIKKIKRLKLLQRHLEALKDLIILFPPNHHKRQEGTIFHTTAL